MFTLLLPSLLHSRRALLLHHRFVISLLFMDAIIFESLFKSSSSILGYLTETSSFLKSLQLYTAWTVQSKYQR